MLGSQLAGGTVINYPDPRSSISKGSEYLRTQFKKDGIQPTRFRELAIEG